MAIDTQDKRYSALGSRFERLPFGRRFATPLPDGSVDQADRQQLGYAYGGILAIGLVLDLIHSPADIVRWLLIDLALGTDPNDAGTWPIFAAGRGDLPDNAIGIYDRSGRSDGRDGPTGRRTEHYGIEIIVRSDNHHPNGYRKAQEIAVALDEDVLRSEVVADPGGATEADYRVQAFTRDRPVLPEGRDRPTSKRARFSISGVVSVKRIG